MSFGALVGRLTAAGGANLPDALMVAGAGAVSYGAWLIYAPAGFITGGMAAIALGVLTSSKSSS